MSDGDTVWAWWSSLQPTASHRGDRATLARLRRAHSPLEAAAIPTTVRLCIALGRVVDDLEFVAVCASVLSNVRAPHPGRAPHRLRDAGMSPMRFDRLVQARTGPEMLMSFRRAVTIADHRIDVRTLADGILGWSSARMRRNWIFDFYTEATPPSLAKENAR